MFKWIISLSRRGGPTGPTRKLSVGSRVKTTRGEGTVVGGAIHVKLDKSIQTMHPHNLTYTFNLDDIDAGS